MKQKALNLLGLMTRAGKIVTGDDLVKSIQNQKINLLLVSEDCGPNTYKKLTDKAQYYKIETVICFTTDEISNAIGRENRVAVGIADRGFSNKFKELIKQGGCIDNGKNQST